MERECPSIVSRHVVGWDAEGLVWSDYEAIPNIVFRFCPLCGEKLWVSHKVSRTGMTERAVR